MAEEKLTSTPPEVWPSLPWSGWTGTRETLHMYAQIVGKVRLALSPRERQWAQVPLYLSARGLTTSAMPHAERMLQIDIDLIDHVVRLATSNGALRSIPLVAKRSVAGFYELFQDTLRDLDVDAKIWPMPVEVPRPVPFGDQHEVTTYDPDAAHRFWQVLVRVGNVFAEFRAPFPGRHTPVDFFWGTLDLAYTRYSGRPALPPPNSDPIMRVAMEGESVEAGFWAGDERFPEPAFFCFGYPKPPGIERARIQPATAFWSAHIGEFLLRYEDVRAAPSPRAAILAFLESTYAACASLGEWSEELHVRA